MIWADVLRQTDKKQQFQREEHMPQLVALSLSIAVLGAIWAFLALGPLSGFALVWAGFIGWGCFFHSGANNNALVKTIIGNVAAARVSAILTDCVREMVRPKRFKLLPQIRP